MMIPGLDRPWVALGGIVLAVLAGILVRAGFARRRARLARYGAPEALVRLAPPDAGRPPTRRAIVLAFAVLCIAVGLAGPRWGENASVLESEGIDVAIALDVSLSMLAEDEQPSRLERMKQEVRRLRAAAPGDRVALIAFAGRSYILAPLTADDGALDLFLSNLDPSIVGQPGSALAPPIRQGIELLTASNGDADRALVIMSDGEAFDDHADAVKLAGEAKAAGVFVVTVGFGTPGGGTIPMPGTGGAEVKRDEDGQVVISKADDRLLEAIATAAGGQFIPADATDKGNRIRRALGILESSARAEQLRSTRPLQFQWFVALALLIILLDALVADGARWPQWLRRRNRSAAPALLLLALSVGAPSLAAAQSSTLDDALTHHRAGRYVDAIKRYRELIDQGDQRGVVLYDLGHGPARGGFARCRG